VLDLERLARHRGSLLGDLPGDPQPSQKAFDTDLLTTLSRFDIARPVYVESESRKIGTVQVPDALLEAMRAAACVRVETPQPLRVALLKDEYAHLVADPASLADKLAPLVPLHGRKIIERWVAAAAAGEFDTLIDELLVMHYDPIYGRSILRNYPRHAAAISVTPHDTEMPSFRTIARDLDAKVNATLAVPA
jgi:tRNA 2-selenouridine synthase